MADAAEMKAKAVVDWVEWARSAPEGLPEKLEVEIPVGKAVGDGGKLDWDKAADLMMEAVEAAGGAKCEACSWDFTSESVSAMMAAGIDLGELEV